MAHVGKAEDSLLSLSTMSSLSRLTGNYPYPVNLLTPTIFNFKHSKLTSSEGFEVSLTQDSLQLVDPASRGTVDSLVLLCSARKPQSSS